MMNKISDTTKAIQDKIGATPKLAVTLGSGLGDFVDSIENKVCIPYKDLPHFHSTTVAGHTGQLVFGKVAGQNVLALQGRIHAYEGHDFSEVVFPTRVMNALGTEIMLLTNASGGINTSFHAGQLVLINDHINLTGRNPLLGKNIDELGPRFPDMTHTYDPAVQELILKAASEIGYDLKTGVYAGVLGPSYETPAEVRMLRTLGADMVGMSTVPEAIAGRHCGLKMAGISCITNMAAGIQKGELSHDDIKEEGLKVMKTFVSLVEKFIGLI